MKQKDPAQLDLVQLLGSLHSRAEDDGMIRRAFGIEVKAGTLDEDARTVRVIASTDAIDSYDEIVEQDWDLSRYKKNPVVLYVHNRNGFLGMGGDPEKTLPIGYAKDVGMVDGHLEATLKFVTAEATPMAEKVWQGFKQGSIRAVSVGFYPREIREERREDRDYIILSDNQLWEISAVPLPANADAVALSADETKRERAALLARARAKSAGTKPRGNTMDEKEVKAELDRLKAALAVAEQRAADEKARADALQKAAAEAKKTGESVAVVRALVGKKIRSEQVDHFVALHASNPELFKSLVDSQPDLVDETAKAAEKAAAELVGKKLTPAQKDDFVKLYTLDPKLFESITTNLGGSVAQLESDVLPADKTAGTNTANKKRKPSTLLANAEKAGSEAANKLAS